MEITQLQIDLFKSLAGLVLAGGMLAIATYISVKIMSKINDTFNLKLEDRLL